ncbi:MAG: hypothetical protein ACXACG_03170 [Candidatus Thorarchaeota archaeon]|jgi:Flp pilus assembly protein TadB
MQENKLNRRLGDVTPARIKQVSYPQLSLRLSLTKYLRLAGGVLLVATLLIPVYWIPGLVILVLPAEVYLLDWVHSQYTKSHTKKSLFDLSSGSKGRKRAAQRVSEAEQRRVALRKLRQPPFIR